MDRKKFIKQCGFACISGTVMASLLESCAASKTIPGNIVQDYITIPFSAFDTKNTQKSAAKKYVVIQNDALQYPICVFRFSDNDYSALWMQCTHQGTELQVFGDKLQCPAHGSEFDNRGNVSNGPAAKHLRTLPVTIDNNQIKISLAE